MLTLLTDESRVYFLAIGSVYTGRVRSEGCLARYARAVKTVHKKLWNPIVSTLSEYGHLGMVLRGCRKLAQHPSTKSSTSLISDYLPTGLWLDPGTRNWRTVSGRPDLCLGPDPSRFRGPQAYPRLNSQETIVLTLPTEESGVCFFASWSTLAGRVLSEESLAQHVSSAETVQKLFRLSLVSTPPQYGPLGMFLKGFRRLAQHPATKSFTPLIMNYLPSCSWSESGSHCWPTGSGWSGPCLGPDHP